jgi:hypothetical protein
MMQVRRQQLLNDTVLQMRRANRVLKRPLKVKFISEEGVDEGGVTKEFFQVVIEMTAPRLQSISVFCCVRHDSYAVARTRSLRQCRSSQTSCCSPILACSRSMQTRASCGSGVQCAGMHTSHANSCRGLSTSWSLRDAD